MMVALFYLILCSLTSSSARLGFPSFAGQTEGLWTVLFSKRWLPTLTEVEFLPRSGADLHEDVQKNKPTAGSLHGWRWRDIEALPLSWFSWLAVVLSRVELDGVLPQSLLDAYIAVIPKVDGDATPIGQRPLCVLPVVSRLWASARLRHLEAWFRASAPASVFSAEWRALFC